MDTNYVYQENVIAIMSAIWLDNDLFPLSGFPSNASCIILDLIHNDVLWYWNLVISYDFSIDLQIYNYFLYIWYEITNQFFVGYPVE